MSRYSRQEAFYGIGAEGQQKLLAARVAIIGLGALGTVSANNLARSGVGFLRLIDRDYVELHNLQRQMLFDENDAAESLPKAIAACNHLQQINSEIVYEPVIKDVDTANIMSLINDVDLVLDATDNFEIRMLINEACYEHRIPWIFAGVLGAGGNTMNILPGAERPCLRCLLSSVPQPGSYPTCSTAGVLNGVTSIIASVQSTEALKILIGAPQVSSELLIVDLWDNFFRTMQIPKRADCPTCARHEYEYYGKPRGARATSLCGRDSVQVTPDGDSRQDFADLARRLQKLGQVKYTPYLLDFDNGSIGFKLFPDGRAIIRNVDDEKRAKSIYSEYIGL